MSHENGTLNLKEAIQLDQMVESDQTAVSPSSAIPSEARRFTITYQLTGEQLVAITPPARMTTIPAASSANGSATAAANSSSASVTRPELKTKTAYDYVFQNVIGEGSFSTVYLASAVEDSSKEFAIKVCEKALVKREGKAAYILREKQVMAKLNEHAHPFFVTLHATFQDEKRLCWYFVISLAKNGEMLDIMRRLGSFDDDVTRFYAAEIVCALEHLHSLGIIHRDLKPENILLNERMHIMISDFGSAKVVDPATISIVEVTKPPKNDSDIPSERKRSFVGTAQYVSPEVLNGEAVSKSCDYWALGCIIYQMLAGLPPFRAATEFLIFQKIIKLDYSFPVGFPEIPKDLVVEAKDRLGMPDTGGAHALRSHSFFQTFDWENLHDKKPPVIVPYLPASDDQPAFHSEYQHQLPAGTRPGLDEDQVARLLTAHIVDCRDDDRPQATTTQHTAKPQKTKRKPEHLMDISEEDIKKRLGVQMKENPYHRFVDGNLILRSGMIDKKKGLFARKRMFLLTTGPHIYYVDPNTMDLKGQIPFTRHVRTEAKNFKTFFIHTPHRTYYLFDHECRAMEWCDAVDMVRDHYWPVGCSDEPIGDERLMLDQNSSSIYHHPIVKPGTTSQSTSFSSTILRKISSATTARINAKEDG